LERSWVELRPSLVIVIAYLLGSVPFGYLIVRASQGGDIRQTGSGGTGATNVSRRAGKAAGVLTLILDALKGAAAVLIAGYLVRAEPPIPASWYAAAAAVAVVIGHMFPVWLGFRGGKGVATGVGVFLVIAPIAIAVAGLVFLLVVWITRYVSLGSMLAAMIVPVVIHVWSYAVSHADPRPAFTCAVIIALLVILAHRENIQRLIEGTESKFK
jgi:glycerol-3-phosphate acyltransferase PlsY